MKILVIFLFLVLLPSVNAIEVSVGELFEIEVEEKVEVDSDREIYFYVGNQLVYINGGYVYNDLLGSNLKSKKLPFGEEISNEERFSFTGKELDSDLYNFGARYYDSEIGRFISVDPIKIDHPYAYTNNNPLNLIDPDGKRSKERESPSFEPIKAIYTSFRGENLVRSEKTQTFKYYSNELIGGYFGVLGAGPQTREYILGLQQSIYDAYKSSGELGVFEYIDTLSWDTFDYAHYRYDDDGPTSRYKEPFEYGKVPEMVDHLCDGNAVCYGKALFTAEVINSNDLMSEDWEAIPLIVNLRIEEEGKSPSISAHAVVGVRSRGVEDEEYNYILSWGRAFTPEKLDKGLGLVGGGKLYFDDMRSSSIGYLGSLRVGNN